MFKRICKIIVLLLAAVILLAAAGLGLLTALEYRPDATQPAEQIALIPTEKAAGRELSVCTWNLGYGGLGKDSDFFMDGGRMVYPPSQQTVEENMTAITGWMQSHPADVWLLQEVDIDASRSGGMNQFHLLQDALGMSGVLAYNYNCPFVPFPVPPLGKVTSGVATLTDLQVNGEPQRISLPCPFEWPVRVANMKRCLLVTRVPIEHTEQELVLVNLHLEAYESGEGRIEQTRVLMDLLQTEYEQGNYVIAGGDFNQSFPATRELYPILDSSVWTPGQLEETLPEGWQYAADASSGTCRVLNAPLSDTSPLHVIDGFILSPNVEIQSIKTVPLQFEHSDHNPVQLNVRLL